MACGFALVATDAAAFLGYYAGIVRSKRARIDAYRLAVGVALGAASALPRHLIDRSGLRWDEIYAAAFGRSLSAGSGYEDNFRAGKIDRKKAARLYTWLKQHHPEHAAQLNEAILGLAPDSPPTRSWDKFLRDASAPEGLEIVILRQRATNIVAFAESEPLAAQTIRLAETFCFRLHAEIAGSAIALQWTKGLWFPLPLSRGGLIGSVKEGGQYLPCNAATGVPVGLSEDSDTGRHRFAFLIAPHATISGIAGRIEGGAAMTTAVLDGIAATMRELSPNVRRVFLLAVLFRE